MDEIKEYVIKVNVNGKLADECLNALQAKELIHCKDCRYGHHMVETVNGEMTTYCIFCTKPYIERGNATHEPDWYCADGKKRTD